MQSQPRRGRHKQGKKVHCEPRRTIDSSWQEEPADSQDQQAGVHWQ